MWGFRRRYPVPDDTIDWVRDSFDWAIARGLLTRRTPLVRLSAEFFSAPSSKHPDFAQALVRDIQRHLGIAGAELKVVPLDRIDARFRHDYQSLSQTAGTWESDGNSAIIRFDREMVIRPVTLIATLAHEVMHHVLHGVADLPPGGPEAEELSTDLHCITMGFGLFQLAGADESGWHGYLRQPTRAHALALFMRLRGLSEGPVLADLPPRCRAFLRNALNWVDRNDPDLKDRLV